METALLAIAVILVVVGAAGLVLPIIPGPPIIFSGLLVAAWAEGFAHVGVFTIAILAVLAALASLIDFLAGAMGAKHFGASRRALIGAMAGVFVGLFFGLPGMIIGPFIGAVLGELSAQKTLHAAGIAGIGTWLGLVIGTAAKIAIGFVMIGIFLLVRFT